MRMTRGWTGLRIAVIALGFLAWNAPGADAQVMTTTPDLLEYSVAGIVGNSGITGSNVISYVPVQNAMIDPGSNVPLGSFQVAPLPAGQTTTYNNTPFTLTFVPTEYNGSGLNDTPITVSGTLNGSVNGPYQTSVQVNFDSLSNNQFTLASGSTSTLELLAGDQKLLVPSSAGGITTMEGQINTSGIQIQHTPEPSTIALFLSTVCGLGLRRYVQVRRQKAHA